MQNNQYQQRDYLPPNAVKRETPKLKIHHGYWLSLRPYIGYVGVGCFSVVSVFGFLAARSATGAGWPENFIKILYWCATVSGLAVVFSVFLLALFWWFPFPMRGVKKQVSADEYSQLLYIVRHWKKLVSQLFEEIRDPERNYLFPGVSRVGVDDSGQTFLQLSLPRQRPRNGLQSYLGNAANELKNIFNFFEVKPDSRTYDNGKKARLLIVCDDATEQARAWTS